MRASVFSLTCAALNSTSKDAESQKNMRRLYSALLRLIELLIYPACDTSSNIHSMLQENRV